MPVNNWIMCNCWHITYNFVVGLNVVAVVCDQGASNRSAIESLVQDARAEDVRNGITEPRRRIRIRDSDVIPLYDVPHLFKGICKYM